MNEELSKDRKGTRTGTRRVARWRRRTAWFALSTFLFNLLTPLIVLVVQPAIARAAPDASPAAAVTVINCDGAGMMLMRNGPDGRPPSDKKTSDGFCPLCTIGASFDVTRPILLSCAPEIGLAEPALLPRNSNLPRRAINATPSAPRAPPLAI